MSAVLKCLEKQTLISCTKPKQSSGIRFIFLLIEMYKVT